MNEALINDNNEDSKFFPCGKNVPTARWCDWFNKVWRFR